MYALILAGGRGERLRPLTDTLPKPMVPLDGKPLLWHQVRWLMEAGVTDVVFLAGYRWEAIQEFFGDGSSFGFRAQYSIEDQPLGTGGAIRKGLSMVPQDEGYVVATNGDIITSESVTHMIDMFQRKREINPALQGTILVVPFVSPYGLVDVNAEDNVGGFREKVEMPHWINGGVYVLARSIEERMPETGNHENSTLPDLAAEGKLGAFRSRAFWRSVDSHKDLREAEEFLTGGSYMSRPGIRTPGAASPRS